MHVAALQTQDCVQAATCTTRHHSQPCNLTHFLQPHILYALAPITISKETLLPLMGPFTILTRPSQYAVTCHSS